jgi:hypothetical protein
MYRIKSAGIRSTISQMIVVGNPTTMACKGELG